MPPRPTTAARAVAMLAAGAIVAAACNGTDGALPPTSTLATTTSTLPPRADDGTLKIGVLLPATGPGETLGTPMRVAIEAGIAQINAEGGVLGRDVEYVVADESTADGMQDLLDEGVDAIVGPASSLVALSQLETAVPRTNGVVVCSPTATALALDAFIDNGYFFRTIPSDSFQMQAIVRQAERTGESTVSVAYLDDPYGRGLAGAVTDTLTERGVLSILNEVPFSGDLEDFSEPAALATADSPGVLIVLADAAAGGRFLTAVDENVGDNTAPQILLNDAIRTARQAIARLSDNVRTNLTGVAPSAATTLEDGPEGAFAGQALDCLNVIALAAQQSGSDAPSVFRRQIPAVTLNGQLCETFAECNELLDEDLDIDYTGASGNLELSGTSGDRVRAVFDLFRFEPDGTERDPDQLSLP
ncbi:MAG TPA: ABC transporter substrate-binding protein [Ilumatobacter sp.]|nr:ABC transporter substrate-binding protein [Ilumatobacter sp.]